MSPPTAAATTAAPGAKAPPMWRTFVAFLAPMMLSNVLQSLSGTINSVFLGQMIGVKALAAATVFFPIMFFFIAFVIGLGMGASVLIGQAYGRGDMERVRQVAGASLAISLVVGVVIAIFGSIFARQLMVGLGTPADILEDAVNYARIMLIQMPLLFVFILTTSILRGVGDAVTPLWVLAFSTATGLIITPLLISGTFGLPKIGVASAAVASAFSFIAAFAWLSWSLIRRNHPLAPTRALLVHIKLDRQVLGTILRLGVPTGIQMVIMAIAEIVLLGMANAYGSEATAAYGAINQVLAYVQFPAMSIGITASILGAQAIGAGRTEQLWPITRTALVLNLIITGAGVVLVYLLSDPIIKLFITDGKVVDLTEHLLAIVLWSTVIFGMAVVFSGMMRSSGTVLAPMALSICAIALVEVPVAWVVSHQIGVDGVWYGYPAAFCAMLILQSSFYMFVWRKRSIRALV